MSTKPYNVLIVDDEQYALDGIRYGIDWPALGVEGVFEALDAAEAKDCLRHQPIDLILCDIEMPKTSGLQLLQWVKTNAPEAETVFLTGHADFSYARTALQLGSFDYLLKPVDFADLTKVVVKVLAKIAERRESARFNQVHGHYYKLFQTHKPLLEERFWHDLLSRRISPSPETIGKLIASYELGFHPTCQVIPVLLSVELWQQDIGAKDEDIMEYALRNVASELILGNRPGTVLQDRDGNNWTLFYGESASLPSQEELLGVCSHFIAMCNQYLRCHVSCYVGLDAEFSDLLKTCVNLLEEERLNVSRTNSVLPYGSLKEFAGQQFAVPWVAEIAVLFDLGSRTGVEQRLDDIFGALDAEPSLSVETLLAFFHALVHTLFQAFHRRGLTLHDAFDKYDFADGGAVTRSLPQFKSWCYRVVRIGMDRLLGHGKEASPVMQAITDYINDRLNEDVTREQIAAHVHFNPAYLSRLFKKEAGVSLTDYILSARIDRSKMLLESTRMKISDIAAAVGYDNIPYFSRKFKRMTGVTPQEYRKLQSAR
ncbi:response regulator [Cohnella endophytica]|nr:response regulator [Cohnella endophytica]